MNVNVVLRYDEAGRAAALRQVHAEPLLNGRCVGQLQYDEQRGTCLAMIWHDPKGCEHFCRLCNEPMDDRYGNHLTPAPPDDPYEHSAEPGGVAVMVVPVGCSCAHHNDGSVTTSLCSLHAEHDPCWTMAVVTGTRRRGSIRRGVCSNCGWHSTK